MTIYSSDYDYPRNEYSVSEKSETPPVKCSTNNHELPPYSLEDHISHLLPTIDQISDSHVPKMTLRTTNPQVPLTQILLDNLLPAADTDNKSIADPVFESTRYRTSQRSSAMEKSRTLA